MNERRFTADDPFVPDFPLAIWTILAAVAFAGLLSCFHLIASLTRNEVSVHELKLRVAELQWEVAERVKAMREKEMFVDAHIPETGAPAAPAPSKH